MSLGQFCNSADSPMSVLLDEDPDTVYYAQQLEGYRSCSLVVDYDRSRLDNIRAAQKLCAELSEIDRPSTNMIFNVPAFEPLPQMRSDISAASRLVCPNGRLIYVLPAMSGAKRVESYLREAFGDVSTKRHRQCWVYTCFEPKPMVYRVPVDRIAFYDAASNNRMKFETRKGLFSFSKIDQGSELLLSELGDVRGETLIDVGCGYGILGITAAARGARPVLIDSDSRAVAMAKRNLELNGLNAETDIGSNLDDFENDSFDRVVSNPPTHAGSNTLLHVVHSTY